MAVTATLIVAGLSAPFARAADVTTGTTALTTDATSTFDGVRSIVVPAAFAALTLAGSDRTDLSATFQVKVQELNRSGNSPIRVQVSKPSSGAGSLTCVGNSAAIPANSLKVTGAAGSLDYINAPLSPGSLSEGSYTGANATRGLDSAQDVVVITGESSTTSYNTTAVTGGHAGNGSFHLALPEGATSCTATVTYTLMYA
jgi:hypothetical protein